MCFLDIQHNRMEANALEMAHLVSWIHRMKFVSMILIPMILMMILLRINPGNYVSFNHVQDEKDFYVNLIFSICQI